MKCSVILIPLVLSSFLLLNSTAKCSAQENTEASRAKPTVVISGTILDIDSNRVARVKVDSVVLKPSAIVLAKDSIVNLTLMADESHTTGQTIHAAARILSLGEEITLIQLPTITAQGSAANVLAELPSAEGLMKSDLIVTGKVLAVRKPLVSNSTSKRVLSEHDPKWMNAVISVQTTVKGTTSPQLVVRFPSSLDVAFREMPKFTVGQQGAFVLNKDSVSGLTPLPRINGQTISAFTALSKHSFVPKERVKNLKAALAAKAAK